MFSLLKVVTDCGILEEASIRIFNSYEEKDQINFLLMIFTLSPVSAKSYFLRI